MKQIENKCAEKISELTQQVYMRQEQIKEEDRGSEEVKQVRKFCLQHNWIDETNF